MSIVTVAIPLVPPVECTPNYHGSHWKRAAAVKMLRHAAKMVTVDALYTPGTGMEAFRGRMAPVVVDIAIAWSGRRSGMDDDNAKASCKAIIDGISDALWDGEDGHVEVGRVTQGHGDGTTTVTLRAGFVTLEGVGDGDVESSGATAPAGALGTAAAGSRA